MKIIEQQKIAKDIKILEHDGSEYRRTEYTSGEVLWETIGSGVHHEDCVLESWYHEMTTNSLSNALFGFLGAKA